MRNRILLLGILALTGLVWSGCVERKLLIRSEPPGAPVWIDEQPAGKTPLDHPFSHYGYRRLRLGPLRDQKGALQYLEKETTVKVEAPWYETFPIDFFFEVLWPATWVDEHRIDITLDPAPEAPGPLEKEAVEQLLNRAAEFREKALAPAPEEEE